MESRDWRATRSNIGCFGGGPLERSRQWRGARWAGLSRRQCRAAQSQARTREPQQSRPGTANGRGLTLLYVRRRRADGGESRLEALHVGPAHLVVVALPLPLELISVLRVGVA